ncbi:Zn(2)-C6 fungal-type domain-containing protein [Favolaschia claudopus]|uniref:Zn(2)-C6 fungal-type domain-containing protein n=1 Tax=Favolaschia claudopus TaxID=2862362 RepID=A0AAW0D1B9_9AGAR
MPKGAGTRARGPYALQACVICRSKKSKCDGAKPVCGSCAASGRDHECSWGRDAAPRKPRTEAHFEALRKHSDSQQAYIERLEEMLEKCVCQDTSACLQFRPQSSTSGESIKQEEVETRSEPPDSDEEITSELTLPTQRLKLDDSLGNLVLHGVTSSPFRFGNKHPGEISPISEVIANPEAVYVLQLDGVDSSQTHPDIDWSRYLPQDVVLDRREHDKLLHLAFSFFTTYTLRIVPSQFLRDMYRALSVPRTSKPPRTPHYSPILHNAIFAVISAFSDSLYLRERRTRQRFINTAKPLIDAELWKPDISLVHAFAFLGTYYANYGERIQAELYFGKSTRLSVTLGLSIDAAPWVTSGLISEDERIARNRAHWTIYSLDVCWALYFGRDFCGPPEPRRNIPMPHVDTELDQVLWYHPSANIAPQPNYDTLVFYQSSALIAIAREIIEVVNLLRPARSHLVQIDQQVTKIDLELNTWKSQLPPHLDMTLANRSKSTPNRFMLHLTYWWCFIVLHRPFFTRRTQSIQHSDREVDHVKLCIRAAEHIMELTELWRNLYTLRLVPITLNQIIFNAATIFLLRALQATASPRIAHAALNTALSQVETCLKYLDEISVTWTCANFGKDSLQNILDKRLRPVISRRVAQKSRSTDLTSSPSPSTSSNSPSDNLSPTVASVYTMEPEQQSGPTTAERQPRSTAVHAPADWFQPSAFVGQPETVPDALSLTAADAPIDFAADVDMTALLTNYDFLGGSELWGRDPNLMVLDDNAAAALFTIGFPQQF